MKITRYIEKQNHRNSNIYIQGLNKRYISASELLYVIFYRIIDNFLHELVQYMLYCKQKGLMMHVMIYLLLYDNLISCPRRYT